MCYSYMFFGSVVNNEDSMPERKRAAHFFPQLSYYFKFHLFFTNDNISRMGYYDYVFGLGVVRII